MKTWFITGASAGFGAALAKEALSRGDKVVVSARNLEAAREIAAAEPSRALAVRLDVTDRDSIASAVAEALAWSPRIDVLVNNAGHGFQGAVEEVSDEEARALFDVNVFGLLDVTREVLPTMRRQRSGHVIHISSMAGLSGNAGTGLYCASKFAVEGLGEAMAAELAPLGIKVSLVEPGPFRTEFNGRSIKVAAKTIPDYAETAGKRAAALRAAQGKQPGDPVKAAAIMCDIAAMDAPPLHLVLGATALELTRAKIERLQSEIAAWEKASLATGFDDGDKAA